MSAVTDFDVAICGAGPAGMALAALLARRGMAPSRIALIDGKSLGQAITDPRSIALSYGSRLLLDEVGAWPLPSTPIHQIHVSRRGRFGRSMLDRDDHTLPALGYVTRYGELASALAAACERAGVTIIRPARVSGIDEHDDGVTLQLDDGRALGAALAVQAEGGVFGQQQPRALQRDYRQSAVIARVGASAPIAHRAYERFTDEGPLALLPQEGADGLQYALVWCVGRKTPPACWSSVTTNSSRALATHLAAGWDASRAPPAAPPIRSGSTPSRARPAAQWRSGMRRRRCIRSPARDSTWDCATPRCWRGCWRAKRDPDSCSRSAPPARPTASSPSA